MPSIYLANIDLLSPPEVDTELTSGESLRLWPVSDPVLVDSPRRGDFVLFTSRDLRRVVAVGRIGGVTDQESTVRYLSEIAGQTLSEPIVAVATIVQYDDSLGYQITNNESDLEYIFRESESIAGRLTAGDVPAGEWLLRKLPDEVWAERDPLTVLDRIDGLDLREFYLNSGGGGNGGEDGETSEGPASDGNEATVDRTGTLLQQQYVGRDTIRKAAKSSLQVVILLLGVVVAAASFFRREIRSGAIEPQVPVLTGAAMVGVGTLLTAVVFVHTAVRPRPFAAALTDQQDSLNALIPETPTERRNQKIAKFSRWYHTAVEQLGARNGLLGALVGAAVGLVLGGVTLGAWAVALQLGAGETTTTVTIGVGLIVIGLVLYGAFVGITRIQRLERGWALTIDELNRDD
jgi:hypothetical protein